MEHRADTAEQALAAVLAQVAQLYERGRYLTALEALQGLDRSLLWNHAAAALAAGQVAGMTGGRRLRAALYRRAWQLARDTPALYYHTRGVLMLRGPFAARELIERHGSGLDLDTPQWLSLRAYLQADQRDFRRAAPLMEQALAQAPDDPWLHVEHSYQLEMADRYDAALEAVERALAASPWYRPAVQQRAKLLTLRGEDDAAYAYLQEAAGRLESEGVLAQLYEMQMERGHYPEAQASLQRIDALTPLKDKQYRTWLTAAHGQVAYALGDVAAAIRHARAADTPFQRNLAEALTRSNGTAPRRLLDVEFVRQHHNTCGPATMSALTRYFGAGHDHSALVEAIWYNGTSAYDERRWGNENGWHVREFTVDWDSTVALIERGVPFALATQEADSGHLQAIIGYDANRDFILIRDPYHRDNQEFAAAAFFERYSSSGPRGMVLVPADCTAMLDGIELPDAAAYDLIYQMQDALRRHDRPRAQAALAELEQLAPGSRLALQGARILAWYDRNDLAALGAIRALRQRYPDDVGLQSAELDTLEQLGDMASYIETLRLRGAPLSAAPQLQIRYAAFLANDARQHGELRQRLRHLLRRLPYKADTHATLAQLEWAAGDRRRATRHYRTAANLQIDSEQYALDYFRAARYLRQTDEALDWLRDRMERHETHSSLPVIAYYRALALLSREHEGIALLEAALQRRADDGELLLFTADVLRENGRFEQAGWYLRRAEGLVLRTRWLAAHAKLLAARSRRQEALAAWQEIAALEPLNTVAHRNIADLLATLEGREAAVRHVDALLERYPHIQPVLELRADWFDRDAPAESLEIVRRISALNPANAWAWREQAVLLNRLGQHEAALAALAQARQLEPASIGLHQISGDVLLAQGETEKALASYRHAITLSVDADYAIDRLLQHSYTTAQKRAALAFIRAELQRQVVHGDGLWSYQSWASGILEPEELLAELRHAYLLRPDLWHTSSALARQLLEMGAIDEARHIAETAAERFPLLPRVWIDLAHCRRLSGDDAGEAEALQRALDINPDWIMAVMRLSEHHERRGDYAASRDLLRAYVQRNDSEARGHGYLAAALWHRGEDEAALRHIRRAVELSHGYHWAWERLAEWSGHCGQPGLALEVARGLVAQAPGDVAAWLALADRLGPSEESLDTLRRAIALEPRRIESHDQLMQHLTFLGRFDEARRVVEDPVWQGNVPLVLRTNLPWIRYRQGMIKDAIAEMRRHLDGEPRHAEGWRMLAVWAEHAEDKTTWLEASRHYAQLLPNDAVAQQYLASALEAHELKDEAMAAYRRALQLAPANEESALSLFDLQFAAGDFAAAQQTLALLLRHHPRGNAWIDARQIQLHCHQDEQEAALAALHQLLARQRSGQWPLDTAGQAMQQAGWADRFDSALADALVQASAGHGAVGRAWIKRLHAQGLLRIARRRTPELLNSGSAGIEAVDALLDAMIEHDNPWRVQLFIWRHRQALRQPTATWGTVGYFHARKGHYRRTLRWLADWRQREDAPAWALNNLAVALRELSRWREAAEVCAVALRRDPGSHSHAFHLWLALEAGLRGEVAAMAREMEAIDEEALNAGQQYLYHLLLALHCGETRGDHGKETIDQVRRHLRDALKIYPSYAADTVLLKMRHRVVSRLSGRMGKFPFNLYYYWRLL